ncbi:A/G-specific adenine glycosylase [Paenarthrobacter sp. Z7-10]|uniref:A/G-specific adenine glycosylase n=1 Tax=Paenarthrobacter sp. Z7-10 TaxID=2787635 RepID=UPI003FA68D7C
MLVSEVMLQQTPVTRVLPIWQEWMDRWPTPAALAAEPAGEAVRAWGRLGYPRRALRLYAAAAAITADHDGVVPDSFDGLLTLPGVGTYTAAAVAAFAYGRRATVVDTNIRRVQARVISGSALPAPTLSAAEMRLAAALLPEEGAQSAKWNAAVMELGALVCTARAPKCGNCPIRSECAWLAAGQPAPSYVAKGQPWAGTDRQVRGAVMGVLRATRMPIQRELFFAPVPELGDDGLDGTTFSESLRSQLRRLHSLMAPESQLERAIEGLLQDGLAQSREGGLLLPD